MQALHRLVRFVVLLVTLAAGAACMAGASSLDRWRVRTAILQDNPVAVIWVGAFLCLLGVVFAWTGMKRFGRGKYLCFENEGGKVSISTEAIAGYIEKLKDEFPSIIRLKPEVVPLRSEVDIVADVRIKAGPQIHEICGVLQQRIREKLATGLGISQIRHVEVRVSEINTEHRAE